MGVPSAELVWLKFGGSADVVLRGCGTGELSRISELLTEIESLSHADAAGGGLETVRY
jgi:hypothetical protein